MPAAPYIVGITGGSASGKTLFLRHLTDEFGPQICVISQDNYYHPREMQPLDNNGIPNFDTPESIDLKAFEKDLKEIAAGKAVTRKEYTFNNPALTPKTLVFNPAEVIIIEGIFLLHDPNLVALINLKVFIDTQEEVMLERRIKRDREERGYNLEDVLYRFKHHVSPCYDLYIKPYREIADLVIPNNKGFSKGLEIIVGHLKNKLKPVS